MEVQYVCNDFCKQMCTRKMNYISHFSFAQNITMNIRSQKEEIKLNVRAGTAM